MIQQTLLSGEVKPSANPAAESSAIAKMLNDFSITIETLSRRIIRLEDEKSQAMNSQTPANSTESSLFKEEMLSMKVAHHASFDRLLAKINIIESKNDSLIVLEH